MLSRALIIGLTGLALIAPAALRAEGDAAAAPAAESAKKSDPPAAAKPSGTPASSSGKKSSTSSSSKSGSTKKSTSSSKSKSSSSTSSHKSSGTSSTKKTSSSSSSSSSRRTIVVPPITSESEPAGGPSSSTASSLYHRAATHSAPPEAAPEVLTSSRAVSLFGPRAAGVHYDSRMIKAAQIAQARARSHSTHACWRYVKNALLEAHVVDSRPKSYYAKQAGSELMREHGFQKLSIRDPFQAPIGSVLVYGGRGAGHVEIRTRSGFVSDFRSSTPSHRPLIGVYVKPS